jgi:hypothetical protein
MGLAQRAEAIFATRWDLRNVRNYVLIITMNFPHCAKNHFHDSMKISTQAQESIFMTR